MLPSSQIFPDIRLIAFYLPQFYPFAENDLWWGKGFTEWTNVTKAQPLFRGHYQPHLPADLGFYDLRLAETQRDQARLAQKYGVSAFCYHYYWFSGKRLLEKPLDAMLRDKSLDMPFCLNWANENWTRRWDAAEQEILIAQDYAAHDDDRFADDLLPFFSDPRYLRVDGASLFIVYRPQQIPDLPKRVERWRKRWQMQGVAIHLCAALTHGNQDYVRYGFDSGVEFPPHNIAQMKVANFQSKLDYFSYFNGATIDYESLARAYLSQTYCGGEIFKCVVPSWDNTARKNHNAVILLDGNPVNFELWLKQAFEITARTHSGDRRLVFVNAWNEWAEGCHLEPDRKYGLQFLEAIERVRSGRSHVTDFIRAERPQVAVERTGSHSKAMPVSWKVKRELKRIARQVTKRRIRVPMEDVYHEVMVRGAEQPEAAARQLPASSPTPDLSTFMDYEYKVNLKADQAAAHVIALVGRDKKVLEIGAGSGSITKHLVETNQCHVTAVEINPASIEKLRAITSNIYDLDLNDAGWAEALRDAAPFDCVVAADVLEHLYDPWTVLRQMRSLLSGNGSIVLSLPHAGHCTVLGCLAQNDLEYREWGLLDKTHIRFFGISNMQALQESADLSIEEARFVIRRPEDTEFADRWAALPKATRTVLAENRFKNVYQVVTRSVPRAGATRSINLLELDHQLKSCA
jgi:2-polyprenyl-3-methyl-5-hydroxy-6-metoxy-1,4-benzoquinol methylase